MSNKQWLQKYTEMLNKPPKSGAVILGSVPEDGIHLKCSLKDGEPPFITATLYLPEMVGSDLRWMAASSEEPINGMSCIIGPRTRSMLLKKYGPQDKFRVKSLRISRLSKTAKSYIVEIEEMMPEPLKASDLSPETLASVQRGIEQAKRREFAPSPDVEADATEPAEGTCGAAPTEATADAVASAPNNCPI